MQAAVVVEKNDKLSYLPPDGLVALTDRSAPEATVAKIVGRINGGAKPTAAAVKREIKNAKKAPKREAARQAGVLDSKGQDEQAKKKDAAATATHLLRECLADQFDFFVILLAEAEDCIGDALRELWVHSPDLGAVRCFVGGRGGTCAFGAANRDFGGDAHGHLRRFEPQLPGLRSALGQERLSHRAASWRRWLHHEKAGEVS
jgi:hypothetical protein